MKNKIITTLINLRIFIKGVFFPCIFSYLVFRFSYFSDEFTWIQFNKVLALVFSHKIKLVHPVYIILCPLLWSQLIIIALALTKYQKARIYFIILQLLLVVYLNICIFYYYDDDLPPSYKYLFRRYISLRILTITNLVNLFFRFIFAKFLDDDYNIKEVCFSLFVLFLVLVVWLLLISIYYLGPVITIIILICIYILKHLVYSYLYYQLFR